MVLVKEKEEKESERMVVAMEELDGPAAVKVQSRLSRIQSQPGIVSGNVRHASGSHHSCSHPAGGQTVSSKSVCDREYGRVGRLQAAS